MNTKICNKCNIEKNINEFSSQTRNTDGLRHQCKLCLRLEYKIYISNNKEKELDRQRKVRNSEMGKKIQERSKAKRHERTKIKLIEKERLKLEKIENLEQECFICKKILNKEKYFNKCKANVNGYAGECKSCKNSKHQINQKTIEKNILNQKEIETNTKYCPKCNRFLSFNNYTKSKIGKYGLQVYCKECRLTYQNTVSRKIHNSMSIRVRNILKHKKMSRKTFDLLGFTKQQLMYHLEKQFDSNMNWDNYGSYWHIDHIIPVSYFEIDSAECDAFKLCWRLENLRPLEAMENMKKSSKILEEFKYLLESEDTN